MSADRDWTIHPFVNAHGQRHGQDAVGRLDEHAHGLQGVPMMYSACFLDSDC
jgi:hypothetical protein